MSGEMIEAVAELILMGSSDVEKLVVLLSDRKPNGREEDRIEAEWNGAK